MRAVVVGAGVVGLSAAIRLLEDGADVRVVARERTPSTTSDVAAAVDFPYRAGDAVVNCAGLGARELAGDARVHAVRGQVARVRNPGLARAVLDETAARSLAYVIPRSDGVIVGGTADERAEDLTPDPRAEAE